MNQKRRKYDMVTNKHLLLSIFSYGTILLTLVLLSVVLFWMFYPYNVIESSPKPYKIVESGKTAYQGGVLSYEYDYTKFIDAPVTVRKQFVDGIIFECPSLFTYKPLGTGHVHAQIEIPETLPPGHYSLRIIATYKVNPIREIVVENSTEPFTVIELHKDAEEDLKLLNSK
jgi:hypothetical protein